jgi:hypothetical protein
MDGGKAVKTRKMLPLALAAGCCLPAVGWAKGPWFFQTASTPPSKSAPAPKAKAANLTSDQSLAEAAAEKIMSGAPLEGCSLDITCTDGLIELVGQVPSPMHSAEIEKRAKMAPGIKGVKNALVVNARPTMPAAKVAPAIQQTSAQVSAPGILPPPAGLAVPGGPMAGPGPGVQLAGGDPVPVSGGGPAAYDLNPPRMPANAWPTYAPYNNYSRVAHPTIYPYSAWPFIGPFYPFPKVPLGWRKITLEWEDGHWYYGKNATHHDHWRIRYW